MGSEYGLLEEWNNQVNKGDEGQSEWREMTRYSGKVRKSNLIEFSFCITVSLFNFKQGVLAKFTKAETGH